MRRFIFVTVILVMGCTYFAGGAMAQQNNKNEYSFSKDDIAGAEHLFGLNFTDAERDSMMDELQSNLDSYKQLMGMHLSNDVSPALIFDPVPPGMTFSKDQKPVKFSDPGPAKMPDNIEDLAFYTVRQLAQLIKSRKVTSVQLTQMFLNRLKKYDDTLHCVITLTEDLAMKQAHKADAEIAAGKYRGLLHGIPYGIKDLFAVKGYKTTWGAMPYKNQVIDENATIVKKLNDAGAVLLGKLTSGALAWGDVWYGGKTRNPWNPEQGSSGSSAGPASATSAGLVPFAIGTETYGSIVSPSTRCGTTGLRPTYGRVSRTGGMALSWSMDKVGPITRSVEDAAIVFHAIYGPDGVDQSVRDLPFNYSPKVDLSKLKIGYTKALFDSNDSNLTNDEATLQKLRDLGADLIPIELPDFPVDALNFILSAEAGAAFQELTFSNRDDEMVRQIKNAWPNVFRAANLIPAVEYIQANRARSLLIQKMAKVMKKVDLYVAPSFGGHDLLLTNLTGHPCVVVPNGFNEKHSPTSISFIGQLYDEGTILAVAKKYQDATNFDKQHPEMFLP